jgi:hypothetical protein
VKFLGSGIAITLAHETRSCENKLSTGARRLAFPDWDRSEAREKAMSDRSHGVCRLGRKRIQCEKGA